MHKSALYSSVIFFSLLTCIGVALYLQNVTHGRPLGAVALGLWVVGWMYRRKYTKVFWYCAFQVMAYLLLVPLYYKGVLPEFDFGSDTQVRVALRAFCFGYAVIDNFATTYASTPIELLPLWGLFLLSFIFLASYFYYLSNLYEHYNGNADDGAAAPEQFWKMALDNLENNKDEGLWLRCYSEAGGVNEKARAIYLQYASKRFHNAEERATENNAKAYARSQLISGLVAMVLGGAFFGNILINKSNLMEWMKSPIEWNG